MTAKQALKHAWLDRHDDSSDDEYEGSRPNGQGSFNVDKEHDNTNSSAGNFNGNGTRGD